MDAVINDFVQVLRNHQLRVSPAESLDALHALKQVGLSEREVMRDSLRATMVKNQEDSETFDQLFDLFFSIRPPADKPAASLKLPEHDHNHGPPPAKLQLGEDAEGDPVGEEGHDHGDGDSTDMRRFFDKERMRPSQNIHGEADRMRLSMFSQELILNHRQGALESALQRLTYHLGIRRSRKMFDFSASEQREMEVAIRRIPRRIYGAKTRRLRRDRTGRISVAHTLRHNVQYEGIPFDPVLRRRREGRPRVTLLCDVSLSTRNLARFWLQLTYQMQSLFSKVRTFVFVAEMAEVTQLFEEHNMHRAVDEIFSGRVLDADVNSDFGKAAEQFRNEHLSTINHRTTVVLLGDGRNNGKHPNVEALEEIAQHAKQTIWITPEPRWGWSLGSCDMPLYESICDRVEAVRTVDQLASVAEDLVKTRV